MIVSKGFIGLASSIAEKDNSLAAAVICRKAEELSLTIF
jgi:hypothetical protein